jgi:hypothetical protein
MIFGLVTSQGTAKPEGIAEKEVYWVHTALVLEGNGVGVGDDPPPAPYSSAPMS